VGAIEASGIPLRFALTDWQGTRKNDLYSLSFDLPDRTWKGGGHPQPQAIAGQEVRLERMTVSDANGVFLLER